MIVAFGRAGRAVLRRHVLHHQPLGGPVLVVGGSPVGGGHLGSAGGLHHGLGLDEDPGRAAQDRHHLRTTCAAHWHRRCPSASMVAEATSGRMGRGTTPMAEAWTLRNQCANWSWPWTRRPATCTGQTAPAPKAALCEARRRRWPRPKDGGPCTAPPTCALKAQSSATPCDRASPAAAASPKQSFPPSLRANESRTVVHGRSCPPNRKASIANSSSVHRACKRKALGRTLCRLPRLRPCGRMGCRPPALPPRAAAPCRAAASGRSAAPPKAPR